jgi:hypothetical protein
MLTDLPCVKMRKACEESERDVGQAEKRNKTELDIRVHHQARHLLGSKLFHFEGAVEFRDNSWQK